MRRLVVIACVVGASYAARAGTMTVSGNVVDVHSHWTASGSRIITEATVQSGTGSVVVSQLGGSVGGIGMRTFPGPPVLALGMTVQVGAHDDVDLLNQPHVVVDSVDVIAAPPSFVRTGPTAAGHYLYWESGCIFVTVDADGTKEIAGNDEFPIIDASIATWNTDVSSCSYIQVMSQGTKSMEVGRDNINLIKFRDVSWCRPAEGDDPARCYSDSAAGITTATYVDDGSSSRDGAIVDADIEINGVDFAISVNGVSLGTAGCDAELQNTLTHELGHLHGLEHTCLAVGDPARIDNEGNPVPECSATSDPTIIEATMYNFQDCGETKKETLEVDDINAICTVYPTAKDPNTCAAVGSGSGCCDVGREGPTGALLLSAMVGLVLVGRRKTRRAA